MSRVELSNGGILVCSANSLPNLSHGREIFLDLETSGDGAEGGLYPYKGSFVAGICVSVDDDEDIFYIPVNHRDSLWNVDYESVLRWVHDLFKDTTRPFINHNVKFDAHFLAHQFGVDLSRTPMFDTLTGAKVLDSDRGRGTPGYGLDDLAADWLQRDISKFYNRVRAFLDSVVLPRRQKCNDYGRVPADILGEYAVEDVRTTRQLYRYIEENIPDTCREVWAVEKALTPALFDLERVGMRVDPTVLEVEQLRVLEHMYGIEEELHKIVGYPIRPAESEDCFDLFCSRFGLPVLGFTEEGNPSFDKDTLVRYGAHPDVLQSKELSHILKLIQQYREDNTYNNFFLQPYLTMHVNGVMHPDYNQAVRTGRESCRRPNAQQLSKRAKKLIIPDPGYGFGVDDYAQKEFRLICHYGKDMEPIKAFNEDPDTDFHSWVAEMCQIKRSPAKNVNFCIAFGGGKKKVLSMLSVNMDLIGALIDVAKERLGPNANPALIRALFEKLAQERAEEVYELYHSRLPGVKTMTDRCAFRAKRDGYITNIAGRRRHLPEKAAWRAFNSVIQSSAADIMKRQFVSMAPRYNWWSRENGLRPTAKVHDSCLTQIPIEKDSARLVSAIAVMMETTDFDLRVPLRVSAGYSSKSWAAAEYDGKDGKPDNRVKVIREGHEDALKAAREALNSVGVYA